MAELDARPPPESPYTRPRSVPASSARRHPPFQRPTAYYNTLDQLAPPYENSRQKRRHEDVGHNDCGDEEDGSDGEGGNGGSPGCDAQRAVPSRDSSDYTGKRRMEYAWHQAQHPLYALAGQHHDAKRVRYCYSSLQPLPPPPVVSCHLPLGHQCSSLRTPNCYARLHYAYLPHPILLSQAPYGPAPPPPQSPEMNTNPPAPSYAIPHFHLQPATASSSPRSVPGPSAVPPSVGESASPGEAGRPTMAKKRPRIRREKGPRQEPVNPLAAGEGVSRADTIAVPSPPGTTHAALPSHDSSPVGSTHATDGANPIQSFRTVSGLVPDGTGPRSTNQPLAQGTPARKPASIRSGDLQQLEPSQEICSPHNGSSAGYGDQPAELSDADMYSCHNVHPDDDNRGASVSLLRATLTPGTERYAPIESGRRRLSEASASPHRPHTEATRTARSPHSNVA